MIVTVSNPDGSKDEFQFDDTDYILLGRGQSADVMISDDHISRKHLEIKKYEGTIYIKDITLSNWVSFNDEKLEKGVDIQYFDFAPLKLPGGYDIKVTEELPNKDLNVATITSTNIEELREQKKAKRKERKKTSSKRAKSKSSKSEKKEFSSIVLISVAVVGFIVYQFFFNQHEVKAPILKKIKKVSPQKRSQTNRPSPRSRKSKAPRAQSLVQKTEKSKARIVNKNSEEYDLIVASTPCNTAQFKVVCKQIFTNRSKKEGIFQKDSDLYVFKNYLVRGPYLLRGSRKFKSSKIPLAKLKKVVAAENILMPNFMKMMELNNVQKITVLLFNMKNFELNVIGKYEINISNYRNYTQEQYIKAFGSIVGSQSLSNFNQILDPYIKEVSL